jgi:hypothetical protein
MDGTGQRTCTDREVGKGHWAAERKTQGEDCRIRRGYLRSCDRDRDCGLHFGTFLLWRSTKQALEATRDLFKPNFLVAVSR